jgi:hypothetical protein
MGIPTATAFAFLVEFIIAQPEYGDERNPSLYHSSCKQKRHAIGVITISFTHTYRFICNIESLGGFCGKKQRHCFFLKLCPGGAFVRLIKLTPCTIKLV